MALASLRSFASQPKDVKDLFDKPGWSNAATNDILSSIFGTPVQPSKLDVSSQVFFGPPFFGVSRRVGQVGSTQRSKDVDAIYDSLFGKARVKTDLEAVKYMLLFPRRVRTWIVDAKSEPGWFTEDGEFEPAPPTPNVFQLEEKSITRNATKGLPFRRELPEDLRGHYRFGLTPEEVASAPEKVKDILSFRWATQPEINSFRAKQLAKKFERSPMDTGSSEVQVARMTVRIRALTEHMIANHKDKRTKRALNTLVSRRSALMKYLKRQSVSKYYDVITELNLRDIHVEKM